MQHLQLHVSKNGDNGFPAWDAPIKRCRILTAWLRNDEVFLQQNLRNTNQRSTQLQQKILSGSVPIRVACSHPWCPESAVSPYDQDWRGETDIAADTHRYTPVVPPEFHHFHSKFQKLGPHFHWREVNKERLVGVDDLTIHWEIV